MYWNKKYHPVIVGLAACATWLAAASPADASIAMPDQVYEDVSAMAPHLRWKATTTFTPITDESEARADGVAKLDSLASMLPMEDIPTSTVPEPATAGFLLLGTASLWFLKFRRNRQV